MIGSLGQYWPAATLWQHCSRTTQEHGIVILHFFDSHQPYPLLEGLRLAAVHSKGVITFPRSSFIFIHLFARAREEITWQASETPTIITFACKAMVHMFLVC